ncbi:MAG: DUF2840 domain-containing protein [Blastomonas fulva]|uniref:DUF2840 domain-containing protein n=1 Tax=Blastomonas fulva TaxID=1550728 RepID=UPI0040331CD2
MRTALTEVELAWIEGRYEQWLRFGRVAARHIVSHSKCVASFRSGAVFALVCRVQSDFGTIRASADIVMSVAPGASSTVLPYVRPGGDVLLHVETWPRVAQVLQEIDNVEVAGIEPCDASPDHWRHVDERLCAGLPVRPYTAARHAAWLQRKVRGS